MTLRGHSSPRFGRPSPAGRTPGMPKRHSRPSDRAPQQGPKDYRVAASTGCSLVRSKDDTDADEVPSVVGRVLADSELASVRMVPVFDEDPAREVVSERDVEIPVGAVEVVYLVDPDCAQSGSPVRVGPNVIDAGKEIGLARL